MEAVEQHSKRHPFSSECTSRAAHHQTGLLTESEPEKQYLGLLLHISCHYLLTVLSHALLSSCYTVPAGTIVYICIPD